MFKVDMDTLPGDFVGLLDWETPQAGVQAARSRRAATAGRGGLRPTTGNPSFAAR